MELHDVEDYGIPSLLKIVLDDLHCQLSLASRESWEANEHDDKWIVGYRKNLLREFESELEEHLPDLPRSKFDVAVALCVRHLGMVEHGPPEPVSSMGEELRQAFARADLEVDHPAIKVGATCPVDFSVEVPSVGPVSEVRRVSRGL